jgi:photosystem II stability/assembly factor-like uncharacterized protein
MDGMPIWSIAIDPADTRTIFVGVKPAALFRSHDGGSSWAKLPVRMAQECHIGPPMVTRLMVDPQDHRTVWAGVEVDGVYRSLDGGDTWTHVEGGVHPDIHGMAICLGEPKKVLASTPREIFCTTDMGESWQSVVKTDRFPLPYSRGIAVKPDDPNVIFAAIGDSAIGSTGAIQRSTDGGKTWETRPLPVEPNSNIWAVATSPENPDLVLASSLFGEIYRSSDAGDSWLKLKREFSEVGALVMAPN